MRRADTHGHRPRSLAYWEWNPSGWLYNLGVLDFAGSGPVHIASGFGALAWSVMLGRRKDPLNESLHPRVPHFHGHNPFLVGLGTILIWLGWMFFNGASTANLSIRSIYVVFNTNMAASGGGVAWAVLEYLYTRKFSIIGFCSGIIGGLVGITPAAGFVPVYTSCLVGCLTSTGCFYANKYKYLIGVDEGLDIWALHGVGGVIGDILTGFFAAGFVNALDGVTTDNPGGWWDHNWIQMGYQIAAAVTCAAWSFFVSCLLLFVIDRIPGCHLRVTEEDELNGLDSKYFSDHTVDLCGTCRYMAHPDIERAASSIVGVAQTGPLTSPSNGSHEQKKD